VATLYSLTAILLLFGLVPYFGGSAIGLVGADEPRYAQIAREMLQRHDYITPMLYGHPWLEKPALYYWRAMLSFNEFGVSDWSARLPAASFALILISLVYLHMRRFRRGGHLDAALITAACAGFVGFARAASTDMQMAAPFAIGMLGWYAWYETGKKFWLFDIYFFVGAATLAKGPVAPFMAGVIILLFAALRREWSLLWRTIWLPGVALYLAMVLPWFIAVQMRNPSFFRQFFLEHNLERFATNRYQHHQPIYYYLVVLTIALLPWSIIAIRAMVDSVIISVNEWKSRRHPGRYPGLQQPGDAFPEFLVLWATFPIVFFSFSGSKLPGYILPSLPPIAILTGDYLFRIRSKGIPGWLLFSHALLCGIVTFVLLLSPQHMIYETLVPSRYALFGSAAIGIAVVVMVMLVVGHWGVKYLRAITLVPIVFLLIYLLHYNGVLLDKNYSARPLAQQIQQAAPNVHAFAVYGVRRDLVYGLAFYRNEAPIYYSMSDVEESVHDNVAFSCADTSKPCIPPEEHLLVVNKQLQSTLPTLLAGRVYQPISDFEWQGLDVYRVSAAK